MKELYHHIYDGEIFKQSNCIWHENATMDFLRSQLINLGYVATADSKKVWKRGNQTVVVCLVDDFTTCVDPAKGFPAVPEMFDKNTVILTDTYTNCPTPYQILKLPDSFFGIYNYALAIIFFLIMFGDFGISTATSKYVAEYNATNKNKLKAVLFNSGIIILGLTIIITILTLIIGPSYLKLVRT
jgi:hypothetical protein